MRDEITLAVDTQEDLNRVNRLMQGDTLLEKYVNVKSSNSLYKSKIVKIDQSYSFHQIS